MLHLTVLALVYFLPTIVGRHKSDALGIFIVNLLFGWTIIGWVIAMIWACAAENQIPARYAPVPAGRYCSRCGSFSSAGAHFCSSCGHAV